MLLKEEFLNDKRFFIKKTDADRIFMLDIKKYRIEKIKLKKIYRIMDNEIVSFFSTDAYRYLSKQISDEEYTNYCNNYTYKDEKHSVQSFKLLMKEFQDYDIRKGAIVIDQDNIVFDGQHRICILINKYGLNYEIEVVKVFHKGYHIKTKLKKMRFKLKQLCKHY